MKLFIKTLLLLSLPAFPMAQYNPSYWEEISKKQADSLKFEFQYSVTILYTWQPREVWLTIIWK
jgi:hypothetical protein